MSGKALDRVSQLPAGVWAPCLTHADGKFWLIHINVYRHGPTVVMDTPNDLVTADCIEGPWSEPVFLNSSGFDPSLFHDSDWLREFDVIENRWIGRPRKIWDGGSIGITEGPHLLKRTVVIISSRRREALASPCHLRLP